MPALEVLPCFHSWEKLSRCLKTHFSTRMIWNLREEAFVWAFKILDLREEQRAWPWTLSVWDNPPLIWQKINPYQGRRTKPHPAFNGCIGPQQHRTAPGLPEPWPCAIPRKDLAFPPSPPSHLWFPSPPGQRGTGVSVCLEAWSDMGWMREEQWPGIFVASCPDGEARERMALLSASLERRERCQEFELWGLVHSCCYLCQTKCPAEVKRPAK